MKFDRNDPRLTAYALGELGETEAMEMKNLIERDPEAKNELAEIDRAAGALRSALESEPTPRLTVDQRAKILDEADASSPRARPSARATAWIWAGRAGSVLALGLIGAVIATVSVPNFNRVVRPKRATAPAPATNSYAAGRAESAPSGSADGLAPYRFDEGQTVGALNSEELDAANAEPRRNVVLGGSMALKGAGGSAAGSRGFGRGFESPTGFNGQNSERYARIDENRFKSASSEPLSTFSVDVDTASYSNVRRFLMDSQLPPADAVRVEELVNYFHYDYESPKDGKPFAVATEVAAAPWNSQHRLVRVALKGRETPADARPASNLVFLIDVSGSMEEPNRLPLVVKSFEMLVEKLRKQDRVAIVTYAGNAGLALPSTSGAEKAKILSAIRELRAGGSTNGGEGIELAYKVAQEGFVKGGVNRVILATDGDFNVGLTGGGELERFIENKAKSNVFLTVLSFGMGNYQDETAQTLADKGRGNHVHVDGLREARKALVEQAGGTLNAIAKDVKIQVEFNPKQVSSYRLIGYEKRLLDKEDFNDDSKMAGVVGEGHTVTALYEVAPAGLPDKASVDPLKYQPSPTAAQADFASGELLTVKVRWKTPEGDVSEKLEVPVRADAKPFDAASSDFKFAASVAGFGMLLRDSKHAGDFTLDRALEIAQANASVRGDRNEHRLEFVELIKKARSLKRVER